MTMNHGTGQNPLEARVAMLERQARTTRGALAVVSILLLCGGLSAIGKDSAAPAQRQGKLSVPEVLPDGKFSSITTREFALLDEKGKARATLGLSEVTHSDRRPVELRLIDETGNSNLELESGSPFGPSLNISTAGVGSVRVSINGPSPMVEILDDKGKAGALLWFMNGTPHLVMTDDKGKTRAILGYEPGWAGGPEHESRTPSTMALYDQTGRVIWSATQQRSQSN